MHPDVKAALDAARDLRHKIADLREQIDSIRARRPSPSGAVVPEVDAMGRLTALYLAPGTAAQYDNQELAAEIMAAIRESAADAGRQYRHLMDVDPWAEMKAEAEARAQVEQ
ncbi:hypothetical protein EBN03_26040 [Nocardia stercoris]|uniref:YbaB/EbfC family DNA-binding protein n=2 Tax=Nocardia stercoris TaxID=2483361 RepID=A0A3M2KY26_9NOCA|nr:hypothetical protein EBN03_26040 [Nocardia stercoris]